MTGVQTCALPIWRLHQLIQRDLTPNGLGQSSLDTYLESQGYPVLAACQEEEVRGIIAMWTRTASILLQQSPI